MKRRGIAALLTSSLLFACAGTGTTAVAPTVAKTSTSMETKAMNENVASGSFEVKMTPASDADTAVGRMILIKTFHGDLEATSKGEMLAVGTSIKDSAGYVAMERVSGTLAGRKGSFALQHSGTMNRGAPTLSISVVPDSGTEELAGLSGTLDIEIKNGQHFYHLHYRLP